jgi:hypothetical protein
MKKAQRLFDRLWDDYIGQNPEAKKVYDLLVSEGETVVNDHIAFRTFDDPRVGIDVLAEPFLEAGYEYRGDYTFEEKKLVAKHFEYKPFRNAPRIFISALQTEKFSPFLHRTAMELIDKIPASLLSSPDLVHAGNIWGTPVLDTYEKLKKESEYAAWLYVYGFRANHFTVSINNLKKFNDIYRLNRFLKENGFKLNESGGEVKGSPEELLEQSSTLAGKLDVQFVKGVFSIPSCYYEFARRYPDSSGDLYGGFIARSADKIFESTDNPEKSPEDKSR